MKKEREKERDTNFTVLDRIKREEKSRQFTKTRWAWAREKRHKNQRSHFSVLSLTFTSSLFSVKTWTYTSWSTRHRQQNIHKNLHTKQHTQETNTTKQQEEHERRNHFLFFLIYFFTLNKCFFSTYKKWKKVYKLLSLTFHYIAIAKYAFVNSSSSSSSPVYIVVLNIFHHCFNVTL